MNQMASTSVARSVGDHSEELLIIVEPRRQMYLSVKCVELLYVSTGGYSPVNRGDITPLMSYRQHVDLPVLAIYKRDPVRKENREPA